MENIDCKTTEKREWVKPAMAVVALVPDVAGGANLGDEGFTANECGDNFVPQAGCS